MKIINILVTSTNGESENFHIRNIPEVLWTISAFKTYQICNLITLCNLFIIRCSWMFNGQRRTKPKIFGTRDILSQQILCFNG